MNDDLIRRKDAIDAVHEAFDDCAVWDESGHYTADEVERILDCVPSAQSNDWMERNKDRILKAGLEGREVEFRIGGRLFAIRELAQ